jgi:ATP-binding cassette subfamily F protein uup
LIQSYSGTVLLVSHDRTFVDNVVTQSLAFVGDGRVIEVAGGYEDWAMIKHQYVPEPQQVAESLKPVKAVDSVPLGVSQQPIKKVKLSYKDQKELDSLPEQIAMLEAEQATLGEKLSDPSVFADAAQVKTIQHRLQVIETEVETAMLRWASLEDKVQGRLIVSAKKQFYSN